MVNSAYQTELHLQICNYVQKRRICCKNSNYAPVKNFVAIFHSLKGCQLLPPWELGFYDDDNKGDENNNDDDHEEEYDDDEDVDKITKWCNL